MNAPVSPALQGIDTAAYPSAGVGQSVRRSEDASLIQGKGQYSDDVSLAGQVYGCVVRSRHAHGKILGIDSAEALAMPGVLAIYTGADLAHYNPVVSPFPMKGVDGQPMRGNGTQAMAVDKVRYVGDPVALVVAETVAQAREAAEAVQLDIDVLPATSDAREAAASDAEPIYSDIPGNLVIDHYLGDAEKIKDAFAKAAHITKLNIVSNRIVVSAMETRAVVMDYDAKTERFTAHIQSQGVSGMRNNLAGVLGVTPDKMRVLTGQVGGSFGMKGVVFPEYTALLHAARALGRPVKWTDSRSESFVSDHQGRDHDVDAELALDKDGNFLGVRMSGYGNLGAYVSPFGAMIAALNIFRNTQSVYRTPCLEMRMRCMVTNTPPIGAYRGAGRPEGNYIMERLIDTAAREMKIDAIELRRRNHIAPDQLPYQTAVGTNYDSGEYSALMDAAIAASDWNGYEARKKDSAARGKMRGRGLGQYLEITAPPMNELGSIRFEENGDVTIVTGTLDFGQGHATTFAQVLVDQLGVPFERIRLIQGDSDIVTTGGGTGGSKSIMASGAAIIGASEKVIEAGRQAASHLLEAAVGDIEFSRGHFAVAGTDRSIGIMELAGRLRAAVNLPEDCPATLDASHVHKASPSAYPNGCHVAEIEIDPETGVTEVVRYSMVNDFGTVVNPMIVAGQAHGGVVQGIGQALMERTVFDADGQFLTGSYMDYAMPRATDAPFFAIESRPTITATNPLGAKGCGEAGCAGALPSVMNALADALAPLGVHHVNMPATPEVIWALIEAARAKGIALPTSKH